MNKYVLLHLSLVLYSLGGIAAKMAAGKPLFSFPFFVLYGVVLVVLMLYAVLWQQILKRLPLNVAVANKSVIIIWGFIWGHFIFQETITLMMVLGALLIGAGIYLVARHA